MNRDSYFEQENRFKQTSNFAKLTNFLVTEFGFFYIVMNEMASVPVAKLIFTPFFE